MALTGLLYQTASIYRASSTIPTGKSYTLSGESLIGSYPCRISRQSGSSSEGQPQTTVTSYMRGYMSMGADIKEGDKLVCEEKAYRVTLVYKPNNHHIELDLTQIGVEA